MSSLIFVTGATGFIGQHLVRELGRLGHRVRPHSSKDGDIARCRLDATDVEHVFHLAGKSYVPASWEHPRDFYDVNVLGTVNVLDFCRHRRVPVTVVSSYVYGTPRRLPIDEDHPLQPLNPYSHTKILAEEAVRYYQSRFGVRATIVRPFNAYGPGQDERFLVPTIIRQSLDAHADRISLRDLRPRRDYLYVSDLVSLLTATLSRPEGGVYNAGSGESISVEELARAINTMAPHQKPLDSIEESRDSEVYDVVADISRARRKLNWEPRVPLREGLQETIRWMQARCTANR